MNSQRKVGEEFLRLHLHRIRKTIWAVARHHQLTAEEANELRSIVLLKLVQDDYSVLRRGRSAECFEAYLRIVVRRALLDNRAKEWGRWRPPAKVRRLGPQAVELDRRIHRDGLTPSEAIEEMIYRGCSLHRDELERLAAALPHRPRRCRCSTPVEEIGTLEAKERTEGRLEAAERRRDGARLGSVLRSLMTGLSRDDRELLHLRFRRGWTLRRVAELRRLNVRTLYRHTAQLLQRMRRDLEASGLDRAMVRRVLEGSELEISWNARRLETSAEEPTSSP